MERRCLIGSESKSSKYKITIEPTVLLFLAASIISHNLQLNLLLDKTCRIRSEEDGSCKTEVESEVLVSQINSWKSFFIAFFMLLFTSLAGPIIDKNPKRLPYILIIPIIGQLLCDIGNFLSVYFWSWPPWINGVFDALLNGFSGSDLGFTIVCLSYVSYTSSKQDRTAKTGLFYFCTCVGLSLGYFCEGFALRYLGYGYGFVGCWILNLVAVFMELRCVKLIDIPPEEESVRDITSENATILETIQQNFAVLTKKRKHGKKLVIILCLIVFPIALRYPSGELSVLYLFLRRRLTWDAVDYGVYMSFKMILKSAGTLLFTELLKRRLKLHDATIGIIGCALSLTMSAMWMLIAYSWQVYAVTVIGIGEKAIVAVITSLASKCVEIHEYGRLSTLFGFTYIFTPLVYPLYNTVYESTIYTFPSSIFLISISFATICFSIFCVLRFYSGETREKELPLG